MSETAQLTNRQLSTMRTAIVRVGGQLGMGGADWCAAHYTGRGFETLTFGGTALQTRGGVALYVRNMPAADAPPKPAPEPPPPRVRKHQPAILSTATAKEGKRTWRKEKLPAGSRLLSPSMSPDIAG